MCRLSTSPCPKCDVQISFSDQCIHTALVKGMVGGETKSHILSKVDALSLEQTITFMEVGDTGQLDMHH